MSRQGGFPEFPFPFEPTDFPTYDDAIKATSPRTLKEQLICHVMASVIRKPGWMRKFHFFSAKWREELECSDVPAELDPEKRWVSGGGSHDGSVGALPSKVSRDVIDYAMAELRWLVDTHDGGPVEPSPVDGVYIIPDSTSLLASSGAQQVLLDAVKRMEDVPEEQVDYHPGSEKRVIDLVHPSLYPVTYGRTRIISDIEDPLAVLPWAKLIASVGDNVAQIPHKLTTGSGEFVSSRFQWLPAEMDVEPKKENEAPRARFRSYINNINPRDYPELYPALASIFATCFVPLFNRVLTQVVNPRPLRVSANCNTWYDNWVGKKEYDKDNDDEWDEYYHDRQPEQPTVPQFQSPPDVPKEKQVELWGKRLQVIVKIAEVRLTPDMPKYPGGTWHVEGMKNEAIVATGIYYFSSENIQESELLFRKAVDEPNYEQNDNKGVAKVYGLLDEAALVQGLGSVPTSSTGLCHAFPNLYHHRLSPFSLTDPSKPGHRKILVFFLVDPGERIISTSRVPPQQVLWRQKEFEEPHHPCAQLPNLVLLKIIERHCEAAAAITEEEAQVFRLHLMEERKMLFDEATEEILERPFSLCEH